MSLLGATWGIIWTILTAARGANPPRAGVTAKARDARRLSARS